MKKDKKTKRKKNGPTKTTLTLKIEQSDIAALELTSSKSVFNLQVYRM